jgi:hypothetical protein
MECGTVRFDKVTDSGEGLSDHDSIGGKMKGMSSPWRDRNDCVAKI